MRAFLVLLIDLVAMAGAIHDGGGFFAVRAVKSSVPAINSLSLADGPLDGTIASLSETTADYSVIDFFDPQAGSAGRFGGADTGWCGCPVMPGSGGGATLLISGFGYKWTAPFWQGILCR